MTPLAPMIVAAVAAIAALYLHRQDHAYRPHVTQRGWVDIKRRPFFSWPVRVLIGVWIVAMLVGFSTVAKADEAPSAKIYTLELWASVGGHAMARTVGPMTAAQCPAVLANARKDPPDLPPNMRRLISQCVPAYTMSAQLAGWNCAAATHDSVAKHPEVKIWVYGCFAQ